MAQHAKAQRAQAEFRRLQVHFAQLQHPSMVKCLPFGSARERLFLRLFKAFPWLWAALYLPGGTSRAPSYCLQATRLQDRRSVVWPSREQEQQAQQAQMVAAAVHQETQQRLKQAQAQRAQRAQQEQQQQQQAQRQQEQQKQRRQVQAAAAADLQSQQGISSPNLGGVKSLLQAPPGMRAADHSPSHPLKNPFITAPATCVPHIPPPLLALPARRALI